MLKRVIWLLVGLLAVAIVTLMIVTPTPLKQGGMSPWVADKSLER